VVFYIFASAPPHGIASNEWILTIEWTRKHMQPYILTKEVLTVYRIIVILDQCKADGLVFMFVLLEHQCFSFLSFFSIETTSTS